MFNFFKKKPPTPPSAEAGVSAPVSGSPSPAWASTNVLSKATPNANPNVATEASEFNANAPLSEAASTPAAPSQETGMGWRARLAMGLKKTGQQLRQVFTGQVIDEALFEHLEEALLLSDAGPQATAHVLQTLESRLKKNPANNSDDVRHMLAMVLTELLSELEGRLDVSRHHPFVMMLTGVNGAGKTTSIGKLTHHLQGAGAKVLLAAGDTFRAAAKEQLLAWADRNLVQLISQDGADPAAVSFDAVSAAKARGSDVVLIDTAGRLPTQLHLMQELEKIKRVIQKAQADAPHEIILVIDGNTGQNALHQVKAFDQSLGLTGLIITKLDGTAKGGVLASIAMWSKERKQRTGQGVPVYFIGVGERLEDLQPFNAEEFA
jgi:fused signal recognition particle receptor